LAWGRLISQSPQVKLKESQENIYNKGWKCSGSKYCCKQAITEFFKFCQFENLFAKCNYPVAKAFIAVAAMFENQVFCTTGIINMQIMERCIFHGQIDAKTSCN